jgi:hypothetical protein
VCVSVWAQVPEVSISQAPAPNQYQVVYNYTGANLTSACYARSSLSFGRSIKTAISAATNANPVVFTSTGHGFNLNSRPILTISGATVGWVTANATWTATIIDANTFSVVLDSTALGALSGSLVFTTTAPRTTVAEWAVKIYHYTGANQDWTGWLAGSAAFVAKCSDAGSTTLNVQ